MKKITTLSLNCYGIPKAPNKSVRFKILVKKLAELQPDLVMLQEVILKKDRKMLEKKLGGLGYVICFKKNARIRTGGIVIFTNLPIMSCDFESFKVRGSPFPLSSTDRLLKKGFLTMPVNVGGEKVKII